MAARGKSQSITVARELGKGEVVQRRLARCWLWTVVRLGDVRADFLEVFVRMGKFWGNGSRT